METIANYPDLISAELAQSLLEAEGIMSTIPEENIAGLDWRWSTALQGIRLQVAEEDAEAARELLKEQGGIEQEQEQQLDVCPKCGSADVAQEQWKRKFKTVSMFVPVLILFWPLFMWMEPKMRCAACGHRWCSSK
ncbi:MAG TPA: DUF2007 domain-containing protein [Thermoanaerobaculia bacterium]|nr:DUF2007 domain-containing protein [Thermoanaerobaculia bacterium]